ncbi:MAG: N-acetyltransferase [Hyphomonadaceae bacterium]|nr:MAG: N-acetyltransferase GCN5 [Caulobacteraceae bacterium]MBT9446819.1 N-acetyltransferase [Hyphomonadaceae bacterium]TPW03118.1 MAG: N-acetyltransferase GCN5 [Alphaproteobacteria bacterium]
MSIPPVTEYALVADNPRFDSDIERVLDAAFGPGRFSKVSERVREFAALDRELSRVALKGCEVVGCCRIYRVLIGATPALFLGPLAVSPATQGAGLGQDLVGASLRACEASGVGAVIVVGQPRMFAPFGFTEVPRDRIAMPGPVEARRFQWRALRDGGLDGLAGAVRAPRAAS